MNGEKLIERILAGCEVVVVSRDRLCNSSIFYRGGDGEIYAWTRELGTCGPYDKDALENHLEIMRAENADIYVRGRATK